jgi:hypothetical protein
LLVGIQRLGDLELEVWECAPWDSPIVIRVLAMANRGASTLAQVRVQAFIRAPGAPAGVDAVVNIPLPTGTQSYGGECPSWADRLARITWSRPCTIADEWPDNVGKAFLLTCNMGDLPPGGQTVVALIHRLDEGSTPPDLLPLGDPRAVIAGELTGWQQWFQTGNAVVREHVLVESQIAGIRMQQSYDGGMIAGVRRYAYSYIRDLHGATRGLLAAGFLDEAARALLWIHRKVERFGTVINASEMGADVRDFVGGHKGTELPAYVILMAAGFLRHGGSRAVVDACRGSLVLAADEQITASRSEGWRFHYNGDETERYVPVLDGANYGHNKPDWDVNVARWSMPSHVLAMASLTVFARELAPAWGVDPAPYLAATDNLSTSFAATFQPGGRTEPLWTVFADGRLPTYPVPNYLLFPAWVDAPFSTEQLQRWVEAAATYLDPQRGLVPVCPGAVEGACGHGLALLLYGLKRTQAPTDLIARLEEIIRTGGQLQWFGMVNEFYGPNGTPNQHNLRPFETGPLIEALLLHPVTSSPAGVCAKHVHPVTRSGTSGRRTVRTAP